MRIHCAVSVEIDRFSNRVLERQWLPMFRPLGAKNAGDIRRLCGEARAEGLDVFPNARCDNFDERGVCKGHKEERHG